MNISHNHAILPRKTINPSSNRNLETRPGRSTHYSYIHERFRVQGCKPNQNNSNFSIPVKISTKMGGNTYYSGFMAEAEGGEVLRRRLRSSPAGFLKRFLRRRRWIPCCSSTRVSETPSNRTKRSNRERERTDESEFREKRKGKTAMHRVDVRTAQEADTAL